MKLPPFTNLAAFIIFFCIALIEAVPKYHWLWAPLFSVLGVILLLADMRKT